MGNRRRESETAAVTLNSVVWADALTDISPTAKLIAIDLAGASGAEEIGRRTVIDLADFACCTPKDVEAALIELGGVLKIERDGEKVSASFPTRADEKEMSARRQQSLQRPTPISSRRAEIHAHEALRDCALGGEYFDASQERALKVVKAALLHHGVDVMKSKSTEAIL
jgi:hypothetical protein